MASTTDLQKFQFQIEPKTQFETLKAEYKNHVEQLKKEIGSLELIRTGLALSRRQISKLLMVDPSAWTRWTKGEQDAPPHIYQALRWYLQLIEKKPDIHAPLHLEKKMELLRQDSDHKIQKLKEELRKASLESKPTLDPFAKFSELLAENFKKFSESITQYNDPKKALELEILKYDNKKLQEKILQLEQKLVQIFANQE